MTEYFILNFFLFYYFTEGRVSQLISLIRPLFFHPVQNYFVSCLWTRNWKISRICRSGAIGPLVPLLPSLHLLSHSSIYCWCTLFHSVFPVHLWVCFFLSSCMQLKTAFSPSALFLSGACFCPHWSPTSLFATSLFPVSEYCEYHHDTSLTNNFRCYLDL